MGEKAYIMVERGFLEANATKNEPIIIDAQNKKKKWNEGQYKSCKHKIPSYSYYMKKEDR